MSTQTTPEDLNRRIVEVGKRRGELREQRRPHALASLQGDAKAAAAIKKIDAEDAQLDRALQTLEDALAEAEALELDAARKVHETLWDKHVEAATALTQAAIDASKRADKLMRELNEALNERRAALIKLQRNPSANNPVVKGLLGRGPITRAFGSAGLCQHADIFTPGGHGTDKPLVDTDRSLAGARIEMPAFNPPKKEVA